MLRLVRRAALLAAVTLVVALAGGQPAAAHATLLVTTPIADGAVAEPPTHVELVFNEPVVVHALSVRDRAGEPYQLGAAAMGAGGRAVMVPVEVDLPTGVYTVRWEVTGTDGDRHGDEFRFAVGAAVLDPGTATGGGLGVAWDSAALRGLLFAALAVGLGGLVGQWLVRGARLVNPDLSEVPSWLPAATLAGLAAAAGLAVPLSDQLLDSTPGRVVVAEAFGFAAAAGLVAARRAGWAVVPLLLVVAAEAVRSHAQGSQPGWGAVLAGVHLATAAVWVGALVHVVRAGWAWRGRRAAVWWLVSGYSRTALWLAGGVLAAGLAMALLLVPLDAVTTTGYGRTLLVKLALVATAIALAVSARWLLRRRRDPARLARTATVEASVLVVVLAVSAVLTATPPADQESTWPPPAPAVGPVQPIGAMAGQLGLAIAASQEQLVVRVSTPRLGDYYDVPAEREYTLAGRHVPAGTGGEPVTLAFRPCGDDCFVADARWAEGENLLTLRATAQGWQGGDASVVVPWPVTPVDDQLARVVAAMDRAGGFTVLESISSDTSRPMPAPQPLPIDAGTFLSDQPYGTGVAPQGVVLPDDRDGRTRLRLGFPAERRFAELVVAADGRLISEALSGPKHVIRRSFQYQDQ